MFVASLGSCVEAIPLDTAVAYLRNALRTSTVYRTFHQAKCFVWTTSGQVY